MNDDAQSFDPRTWVASRDGAASHAQDGGAQAGWRRLAARPAARWAAAGGALTLLAALILWGSRSPAPVPSAPVAASAPSARATPGAMQRRLLVANASGLRGALVAEGISPAEAAAAAAAAARALAGRDGELHVALGIDRDAGGVRLVRMEALFDDSSGALVTRAANGEFTATKAAASLTREIRVVRAAIDADSFYSSAVAADVPDVLVPQIARALAFDFDFQREIHPGDIFEVAYEQAVNRGGTAVGAPTLVFVSLTTADKSVSLFRFTPQGGEAGWYDGSGASTIRALMRTPVDGARVSSGFGMRMHPIQGFMKMHNGTDFAAPTGTPVYASGDAVVEWAAPKGANGNFVRLRHTNGWLTLYLHLSRFADGIVAGVHVRQGQQIGEVGETGAAKGPHLHYEVHIDGQKVDPLTIAMESRSVLSGAARTAFLKERARIDAGRRRRAPG